LHLLNYSTSGARETGKGTRVKHEVKDGKKVRVSVKSGKEI